MTVPNPPVANSLSYAGLLDLPDEVLCEILSKLSFRSLLCTSWVSHRLNTVAAADLTLWQRLPAVTPETLHIIQPFIARSGPLGVELTIRNILLSDLPQVCPFVANNLARLQYLCLTFIEPEEGYTLDHNALDLLHDALSRPAPLLSYLALDGQFYEPFDALRPDILGGVVGPQLRVLHLTAFDIDGPYAAFEGVQSVVASVGALFPLPSASDNPGIHKLFPAIQALELSEIDIDLANDDDDDEDVDYYALARVPPIDQPLSSLFLSWHRAVFPGDDLEDEAAVEWLKSSIQHVGKLDIDYQECPAVWTAVLASLVADARTLRITPNDTTTVELALWSHDRDIVRTASVTPPQAHAQLDDFLRRGEFASLDTLIISTDRQCIEFLIGVPSSWHKLARLRELGLLIDWHSVDRAGSFIVPETLDAIPPLDDIRTLRIQALPDLQRRQGARPSKIDAAFLLDFTRRITPKATKVIVQDIELFDAEDPAAYPECDFTYTPPW
ncbi:hypothetical protein AURDEDRAFT_129730 [Auricularia subglabra TFB-10046 SS5]|uniref:F-box domain-containing protein n=1 Tax=Auricularia subglabra (strain TFB-10046 / SS5) TaxID=717982 RepID=J0LGW9_AURST|nr:hypothetical protein AURDEDRAFT_129730 [Auricularia subglabra TFB-10046 SS5]